MSEEGPLSCRLSHTPFLSSCRQNQALGRFNDEPTGLHSDSSTHWASQLAQTSPAPQKSQTHKRERKHAHAYQSFKADKEKTNTTASFQEQSFICSSRLHESCQCRATSKLPVAYKSFRNRLQCYGATTTPVVCSSLLLLLTRTLRPNWRGRKCVKEQIFTFSFHLSKQKVTGCKVNIYCRRVTLLHWLWLFLPTLVPLGQIK